MAIKPRKIICYTFASAFFGLERAQERHNMFQAASEKLTKVCECKTKIVHGCFPSGISLGSLFAPLKIVELNNHFPL